jgi:CRP-like cAMP-binding protein
MISPEVLRRYPFFGFLQDDQLSKVAMLAEEVAWETGEKVFEVGGKADCIFLLTEGDVDLRYFVEDAKVSRKSKDFSVGEVNPGEPFGLSALMGTEEFTANAVASVDSKGIKVDSGKLIELAEADPALGYGLMLQVAKSAFERLDHVRVQWVAASN